MPPETLSHWVPFGTRLPVCSQPPIDLIGELGTDTRKGNARTILGKIADHAVHCATLAAVIEEAAQEAFDTPRIVELVHNAPQAVWPFADLSQRKHKLRGRA